MAQTLLLNDLYEKMGWYYNLFQPVMRVVAKVVIPAREGRPARVRRRYDPPRTPFDRLCETEAISGAERERLMALRESINPRTLRKEIYALRDALFSLPNAAQGVTENVHQTLHYPLELGGPEEEG